MNLSVKELERLLASNEDLQVVPDERTAPMAAYARSSYVPAGELARQAGEKPPKMSEWEMQKAVIDECDRRAIEQPEWGLVAAIPNGQYRKGQRMEAGLRRGLPDLMIFAARHSRHGCFIELKIKPNKPDEFQEWWHRRLRIEGYCVEVVYDDPWEVIKLIDWYLFR